MIGATAALDLVREELRTQVLPRLAEDDDYGRSILIAAIGVLGEVSPRVRNDEEWYRSSVLGLEPAAASWPGRLSTLSCSDDAVRVGALVDLAVATDDPAERRARLLSAAQATLSGLWTRAQDVDANQVAIGQCRREVLNAVEADLELQLKVKRGRPGRG